MFLKIIVCFTGLLMTLNKEIDTRQPNKTNIFIAALPTLIESKNLCTKVNQNIQNLGSSIKINWTMLLDLHITLGYIKGVALDDLSTIESTFDFIGQEKQLKAKVIGAKVFNTALTLELAPIDVMTNMHLSLAQALAQVCDQKYRFSQHGQFVPHITLGRIKLPHRERPNKVQKDMLEAWAGQTFKDYVFDIEEAALMHLKPTSECRYERITVYPLSN